MSERPLHWGASSGARRGGRARFPRQLPPQPSLPKPPAGANTHGEPRPPVPPQLPEANLDVTLKPSSGAPSRSSSKAQTTDLGGGSPDLDLLWDYVFCSPDTNAVGCARLKAFPQSEK